ncbi:Sec-independent protein translocase protein TatB [Actinomycetospora cinnamomea]|nr:Sec-independent protein translocase protein TatB [Actinomycetospora cinnamomea]
MGMGELVLLALVGFFVIGPERLPGAIRSLASVATRAKEYAASVREQVDSAADLAEVRRQLDELREPLAEIRSADPRRAVRDAFREVPEAVGQPEPRVRVRTRSRI